LLLILAMLSARAADLPPPLTLDIPIPANLALPTWLGEPTTPATTFATLDLPIFTPDPEASLLVTVYFQEKQDGFMRISWQGTQGAQVLSDNFYENIGMANQRSLLISPSTLIGDGTLIFQCSDATLGIERIKLEWLENKESLVSPQLQDLLVTPSVGPTQASLTLNGQPAPAEPGAWQNELVTVPLIDSALRIEEGVEFSVDLDKVPSSARLAFQEAGLPFGQHLVVWINQQRAGTITPSVPDLLDSGFISDATSATNYVGWRDGSYYVPVSLLKQGINTVQFSGESETAGTSVGSSASDAGSQAPVAIKGLVLQLDYTTAPTITSTTTSSATSPTTAPVTSDFLLPQPSLEPTGPIEPTSTETPSTTTTPTTTP